MGTWQRFAINRRFWKNRPRPTVNKREKRRENAINGKQTRDHTKIRPENATRDGTEEKENATETTTNARRDKKRHQNKSTRETRKIKRPKRHKTTTNARTEGKRQETPILAS